MKKRYVALLLCAFLLATSFICVGYAALTDNISVSGTGSLTKQHGLYISAVEYISSNNAKAVSQDIVMPTNVKNSVTASSRNATVTYAITVTNDTDITYWYLGATAYDKYGNNALIGAANGISISTKDNSASNSSVFDTNDWIPPKSTRVFYATYTYGNSALGSMSTLVNFNFGLKMDAVEDEVLAVLNDKISPTGYQYLSEVFDKIYAEEKRTVIGNVGEDAEVFRNLFGADLTIDVNGVATPVTIMIERKNVDGNANSGDAYKGNGAPTGCEYTIYVTTENLDNPGSKATVYAVSYTCGSDGMFYQIGELYEGECTITDYDTSDQKYEGAFSVSDWKATEKIYTVTDKISYKVGYEQGTEYDKLSSLSQLMSTKDQEFYNAVNNNSGDLLKPVCNVLYSYYHNNGQYIETENFNNKGKQGYDALKVAFDKVKPYCLIANGAQEVKIQNASSLSRAELIQYLSEIQSAYDYYKALNPNG